MRQRHIATRSWLLLVACAIACGGDATGPESGTPNALAGGPTVAAGLFMSCALGLTGAAYCWGASEFGTLGRPEATRDTALPIPVASTRRYVAISTDVVNTFFGPSTVCALTAAGEADCWGSSPAELIGPPESGCVGCVRTPRAVVPALRFRRLAVGGGHICGLVADSTAVCWGRGTEGQLGTGSLATTTTPAPVAGGLRFTQIAAGESYTCALTPEGAAYCWGQNTRGQLGDSTQTARSTPTRVRYAGAFQSIDVSSLTTCGVTTTGVTVCWGRTDSRVTATDVGFSGQTSLTPTVVALASPQRAVSIGLGNLCAIGPDAATTCWGWGTHSETGPPDDARCRQSGVELYCLPATIVAPALTEVHVGALHACGRGRDGGVYCWGSNFRFAAGGPTFANQGAAQRIAVP